MKILVLDTRLGTTTSELFALDPDGTVDFSRTLNYVPEIKYSHHSNEIVVLESDVSRERPVNYLSIWDATTFEIKLRRPMPPRPTYSGFPGRSISGSISPSARYVWLLHAGPIQRLSELELVFRVVPCRYDRIEDEFELASFHIDSCSVDFGCIGDEEVFFHLSCEFPSTLAFGSFDSSEPLLLPMLNLPTRIHGPMETVGSFIDRTTNILYCVDRVGGVYKTLLTSKSTSQLRCRPIDDPQSIPIHNIYASNDKVYLGIAKDDSELGGGMASEIECLDGRTGRTLESMQLSGPAMNFAVCPSGDIVFSVSPFNRCVSAQRLDTGEELWCRNLGSTPAEIILIP